MPNSDVSKQILMICFTVRICVLVTGQGQILIEIKLSLPVILTVDVSAIMLSSAKLVLMSARMRNSTSSSFPGLSCGLARALRRMPCHAQIANQFSLVSLLQTS